jgi:outer membrane protein assembly factor BamE (lipoprotein component of BamABCDE complex)
MRWLCIGLLALFCGCAIKTGHYFDYEKVRSVEIGQTKDQIRAIFGDPFMVVHKKGHECWIYNYSENKYNVVSIGRPNQINLGIVFDENDKVYSYEYNRNYEPVERVQIGPFYEK